MTENTKLCIINKSSFECIISGVDRLLYFIKNIAVEFYPACFVFSSRHLSVQDNIPPGDPNLGVMTLLGVTSYAHKVEG